MKKQWNILYTLCMGLKQTSLAKISRPVIPGIVPRDRLFKLLDSSLRKPVVWLSSPAGSGKTTLISSYLDSRKLHNVWYQCDEGDADLAAFFYTRLQLSWDTSVRSRWRRE